MKKEKTLEELRDREETYKTGMLGGGGVASLGGVLVGTEKLARHVNELAKKKGVPAERLLRFPEDSSKIAKKSGIPLIIAGTALGLGSTYKHRKIKKKIKAKEEEQESKEQEKQFAAAVMPGQSASVMAEGIRFNRALMQQRFKQTQLLQKERLQEARRLATIQNSIRTTKNQQGSQRLKLRRMIEDRENPAVKNWGMVKNTVKPVQPVSMK